MLASFKYWMRQDLFSKMDAVEGSNRAKYECLLFDMDDTLYPMSSGLNLACRKNIEDYMLQHLNIEESEVPRMCLELYREYGTTMAGLKALGYEFDDDEFHAYVHGRLPYESLKPDPVLRNLLLSMPQRKIIFTNADREHAAQVLNRLGLEGCFEGVICFETLNPPPEPTEYNEELEGNGVCKEGASEPEIMQLIWLKVTVSAPDRQFSVNHLWRPLKLLYGLQMLILRKHARNIASGKAAGLHTVIVGSSVLVPGADHALGSIHNIKEALPEIWEGEEGEQLEQVIQSTAVETVVLA
ncbi:Uncharacterized protein C24B11.05 [Vitis vinifera]|uniref:Uncharacterized protein C24B11.05 n=1 Tax=Vitis vinifera TaxID=29760 RepID=A0A438IXX9_VITVI|nr:Uncharacterized protein C24B11.05 [Vitis vinifera]